MKKVYFILSILTGLSNLLFGTNGSIDNIILKKDHIEISILVDIDNQSEIPQKMILQRKSNDEDWIEVKTFSDINNLKYLDYNVQNGSEYAYRLKIVNQLIDERGNILANRSSENISEFRRRTYWTAPEPDMYFRASEHGLTNTQRYDAFISVYLADPDKKKVTKPLFILDGFDRSNARSVACNATSTTDGRGLYHLADGTQNGGSHFYDNNEPGSQSMIDEFQSRCYDIIFIDWIEGAGDIIQNAELFENIIDYFNTIKSSGNKNVVLGPSMGGLIARYALADMEQKGINHDFNLFISLDSPHNGANIPLGLQEVLNRVKDNFVAKSFAEKELKSALADLNSKAAKQMAMYHHLATNYYTPKIPRPSYEYYSFYGKLSKLNNGLGWPKDCFKIGISNGSGDNRDRHFADNLNFVGIGNNAYSIKAYPVSYANKLLVKIGSKDHKLSKSGLQIDNAPGGFSDLPYILNDLSVNPSTKNKNDRSCFISVPSALGLGVSNYSLNFNWIWNKTFEQLELTKSELAYYGFKTPFDVCLVQDKNQQHVFIGKNTKKLTLKYLDLYNISDLEIPHQSGIEYVNDERSEQGSTIKLCDNSTTKDLIVNPGASYSVFAEKSITWMPGFMVNAGGEHVSMIVDSLGQECEVNLFSFRSLNPISNTIEEVPSNVEVIDKEILAEVFPNPTKGKIEVEISNQLSSNSCLDIIDSQGRVIKSFLKLGSDLDIDLSEYDPGIYYLKIKDNDRVHIEKVVKQ